MDTLDKMKFGGLWILLKTKNEVTGIYNNYFDLPDYFDSENYFDCGRYLDACGDDIIYKRSIEWARARIQQSPANADPVFVVDITSIIGVLYYGFSNSDKLYSVDSKKKIYDVCQDLLYGRAP